MNLLDLMTGSGLEGTNQNLPGQREAMGEVITPAIKDQKNIKGLGSPAYYSEDSCEAGNTENSWEAAF